MASRAFVFSTSANTLLQLSVPDELRGRVLSVYMLLFAGSTPIGGLLIGSLSNVIGVSLTLLLCATLCLAWRGRRAALSLEDARATMTGDSFEF